MEKWVQSVLWPARFIYLFDCARLFWVVELRLSLKRKKRRKASSNMTQLRLSMNNDSVFFENKMLSVIRTLMMHVSSIYLFQDIMEIHCSFSSWKWNKTIEYSDCTTVLSASPSASHWTLPIESWVHMEAKTSQPRRIPWRVQTKPRDLGDEIMISPSRPNQATRRQRVNSPSVDCFRIFYDTIRSQAVKITYAVFLSRISLALESYHRSPSAAYHVLESH